MATNWEPILRNWAKSPSETEDQKRDKTELQIRDALKASSALSKMGYRVYVKGSYANNTNVRLDYDVDIAVECTDFYYVDPIAAVADVKKVAAIERLQNWTPKYTKEEFKDAVGTALTEYFGSKALSQGNMAYRVREKKTTLPADVVPCFQYHYIWDVNSQGDPLYYEGSRIYPPKGDYVHNWPKQQLVCGVTKNDATGRRYKRMVRILKRIENELVKADAMAELPSFFMECLVYNVPNDCFNHDTYVQDMRHVLATIFNQTLDSKKCEKWLEASERKYLFHSSQSWTVEDAHELSSKAWKLLGYS